MTGDKRRVVVTGVGAITPLGNTLAESWEAICKGESGVGEERLCLGPEQEHAVDDRVVEGLDADAIARHDQAPPPVVPEG